MVDRTSYLCRENVTTWGINFQESTGKISILKNSNNHHKQHMQGCHKRKQNEIVALVV